MGSIDDNRARAERAGFEVIDTFTLPVAAWWEDYYTPLLARCDALEGGAGAELAAVIALTRHEIDLFRRFEDAYGYVPDDPA